MPSLHQAMMATHYNWVFKLCYETYFKTYQLLLLLNDKDLNVVIVVKHVLLKEVWKKPLILELDLNFSDLWPLQV